MNRIVKIGMDVHSTNYTLCAMEPVPDGEDRIFANIKVAPDYKNVIQFISKLSHIFAVEHRLFLGKSHLIYLFKLIREIRNDFSVCLYTPQHKRGDHGF